MDAIKVQYLDKNGQEWKCSNDFDTMREARSFFQEIKNDRGYFERVSESKTAPETLDCIQLIKNGVVLHDHFPRFV